MRPWPPLPVLSEPARNIVFSPSVPRISEDLARLPKLYQDSPPGGGILIHLSIEKGGLIRDPCGLLQVMSDYDYGIVLFQLLHQILNPHGGNGIQSRRRLIHEDDIGLHRNCPSNAETLLLPSGQSQSTLVELATYLIPQRSTPQRTLHQLIHVTSIAIYLGPKSNIVIDGLGEGIRSLEHHANVAANSYRIHFRGVDILPVVQHFTCYASPRYKIVHAVEATNKSALSAARRRDYGRDLPREDIHAHVLESQCFPIPDLEITHRKDRGLLIIRTH